MGENFPIGADVQWRLERAADGGKRCRTWKRLGVNVLEQPLPRGEFRATARIRQRTSIPIMLDEGVFTARHAVEAVRTEACDVIQHLPR